MLLRNFVTKDLKEIIFSQNVSLIISIINGFIIASSYSLLIKFPGLLILIPGFIQLRGSVYSRAASKISSNLVLGNITTNDGRIQDDSKRILKEILSSLLISIIVGFILSVFVFFVLLIFRVRFWQIILIGLIASLLSSMIMSPLVYFLIIFLLSRGLDVDLISGSIITSLGDLIGTLTLFLSVFILF